MNDTTPEERAQHIIDTSLYVYLKREANAEEVAEIISHIAAEIRAAIADQWISVDDRLPENGQIVLVDDRGKVDRGEYEEHGDSYYFRAWTGELCYDVTRWMPMPLAPAQEPTP